MFFFLAIFITLGLVIFATEDAEKIGWGFYVVVPDLLFQVLNAVLFISTKQMEKYLIRQGISWKDLVSGKKLNE